jgi:hypothetical protein
MAKWLATRSQAESDYELVTLSGTYTREALRQFLEIAAFRGAVVGWSEEEIERSSELDGLCAFDTPEGVCDWYTLTAFPEIVVEFEGEFVCSAPDDDSAVVARFLRETGHWDSLKDFRAAFGI